ncbi:MAG TPA: SDR family oxidoreductase [Usitatibacter sp.]|nr:SDR family oxidoreductase [Usitatibacter sp.]
MARVLILGATSAIAQATSRIHAGRGDSLFLVARDRERLASVAADLRVRGAMAVETLVADLADDSTHERIVADGWRAFNGLDVALLAYGVLGNQREVESSPEALKAILATNFTSAASLLMRLAALFERQRSGALVAIGSVAGDRGRQSNYAYGAAKGGLAIFMEGLRHRLAGTGVRVVTIKPGFVDTPMTRGFPKGPLWASPERVAAGIVRAIDRGASVAYVPGFWWAIMRVIRSLPEWILFRTRL